MFKSSSLMHFWVFNIYVFYHFYHSWTLSCQITTAQAAVINNAKTQKAPEREEHKSQVCSQHDLIKK
jgi:hypothetical protein